MRPDDFAEYAALSRFLRGYLHQDALKEYGSATAAAQAFRRDADERETAVVHAEFERLLSASEYANLEQLRIALQKLGCAWYFHRREEVERVRDALK